MRKMICLGVLLLGSLIVAADKFTLEGIKRVIRPGYRIFQESVLGLNFEPDDFAEHQKPNWLLGSGTSVAISLQDELNPAVANCGSGNFLVVYERNDDIWGQLVAGNGTLWGSPFVIYNGTHESFDPAVSCNYGTDTFVVVWAYDYKGDQSDIDILAQGVHGDYRGGAAQLKGWQISVSADGGAKENKPSVACNYIDSTCLVAFQYILSGEIDIYGRRISARGSDLGLDGDRFVISSAFAIGEYGPSVAWGQNQDEFMVAWLYDHAGIMRVVYAMVHDTEQGSGANELKSGTTWLINPGDYGGAFDQSGDYVDVDYNPNSGRYLVIYIENATPQKVSPLNGSTDVLVGVLTYPGRIYMDPTYLSNFAVGRPAVVANKLPDSYTSVNEFLVGFPYDYSQDNNNQVMGMVVPDQMSTTNQRPVFTVKSEQKNSMLFYNVDVATKYSNGNYFLVWEQFWTSGDSDIYGQLISHGYYNFLPQVAGN